MRKRLPCPVLTLGWSHMTGYYIVPVVFPNPSWTDKVLGVEGELAATCRFLQLAQENRAPC